MSTAEDCTPTIDEIVQKYRYFRSRKEELEAELKEKTAVYDAAMTQIENLLSAYMHELKLNSLPTDYGTAYKTTVTSITIKNKSEFLAYALENHPDLLQIQCNKTAIKEYEEDKKAGRAAKPYPPGIEVTKLSRVNVRGK